MRHTAGREAILAIILASFAATFGSGCSRKEGSNATPVPQVVVRLNTLAESHPLYEEVRRLRQVESRVLSATGPTLPPVRIEATLPALPDSGPGVSSEIARNIARKREQARVRLRAEAERNITEFVSDRGRRLDRLVDQRRDELGAEYTARDAAEIRRRREEIDAEIVAALERRMGDELSLVEKRLVVRSELAVLRAQLDPNSVFLPPVTDIASLEKEIATLKADPETLGIGMRPRLEIRREKAVARLRSINEAIRRVIAEGDARKQLLAEKSEADRNAEIERLLSALREETDDSSLGRVWETIDRSLRAESIASTAQLPREGNVAPLQGVNIREVVGTGGEAGASDQNVSASRLAQRRMELERWITENVADAARDEARKRRIDVLLARESGEAEAAVRNGREDMTQNFIAWIAPGGVRQGAWEGNK